ncbi:bifunctional 3-(3-hydroxy-phenyl)propionate/3-hydroxycinnamic acid hydroxylase [Alphaproteobacteria bacterium]|nr:bifunctional 3-(3-hydroxy-phenyl)propionate/3-hydroxycinnamic acid hydroxylase [Alphaproteobacteria bacterium]
MIIEYDIIIVGLGPTGGTLANLLALNDLSVLVLEKEASIYNLPRAVHFDDEIMRVFNTVGIRNKLSKKLIINKGTKFVDQDENLILDWPRPKVITENGFYPSYRFHQPDLERCLRSTLKKFKKISIKQNANVEKIISKKEFVEVSYMDTNSKKKYQLKAKYIVGCDGGRSFVRQHINSDMEDLGFKQKWVVIDVILKSLNSSLPDRTIQYCNSDRPATYCRNVGRRRRWEVALKDDENFKTFFEEKNLWNFLSQWIKKDEVVIERKAIYTFESAIAEKWKHERIFLAGDAAHLTPPFMGQGMCAGIRDVSNLAWKLSSSCRFGHNENLLQSYQTERAPNVRDYINTTMKMGELLNAIGNANVSDTVFMQPDGSIKMDTIKPSLGNGLGAKEDINKGKIFPLIKLEDGSYFDNLFQGTAILLADKEIIQKLKSININIPILSLTNFPELIKVLKKFKTKGLIIRPDRFILASTDEINGTKFLESALQDL